MEELNNRTELNLSKWFRVKVSFAVRRVMHVVSGNHVIRPLSRALLRSYHRFYLIRFYRDEFLKEGSTRKEGWKDAENVPRKVYERNSVVFRPSV